MYVQNGTIPVEGVIHKRTLSLFGNVTRQDKSSTEQQLASRQLTVKSLNSHSWFIAVKKLLVKYGLSDPMELLENPPTKYAWKCRVNKQINEHWTGAIKSQACLYPSLRYLVMENYACGGIHNLFNQNRMDPTCMMCRSREETVQHFLLECPVLSATRTPIMNSILEACSSLYNLARDTDALFELIIDCSALIDTNTHNQELLSVEYQARRLCFALNCERYKRLALIPRRNRTVKIKK